MKVVLQIPSGPISGQTIQLDPGKTVRFGRRSFADFALPDDAHMSSLHFMVEVDEKGAVLRDLASRKCQSDTCHSEVQ